MKRKRIALLVCTNVTGGHEFQSVALAKGLLRHSDVTIFLNRNEEVALFLQSGANIVVVPGLLLPRGNLAKQIWHGLRYRRAIRNLVAGYDNAISCAGAVEAGIATGIALQGRIPSAIYLPSFYDRVPRWGTILGCAYNWLLATTCRVFDHVITINRIQAHIIGRRTKLPTMVIRNTVRAVTPAQLHREGKLVFVGRLDALKRVDELLRWCDFAGNPFSEILVIGDGPQRKIVQAAAEGLRHLNARLLGWQDAQQQDSLISANDVLLLNSLLEGEPLVVREALARGMRVLVRNIAGVRGITSRSQRFDDQKSLQVLLQNLSPDGYAAVSPLTESHSRANPDRAFLTLLKTLP